jgi:drug/metabolite transporter (DMT)-like permease
MQTRHFLQLIAMSALWGASFPLLRIASPALGPWVVAATRCILAAIVLGLLMSTLRDRWPPRQCLAPTGAVEHAVGGDSLCAVQLGRAGHSLRLFGGAQCHGAALRRDGAALAGEEKLTRIRLLGCAVGFAGVALLVQLGPVAVTPRVVLAALACVAASASYGFGAILMKRATMAYSPLPSSAVVHIAAALILVIPGGIAAPSAVLTPGAVAAVAVLGTFTSGLCTGSACG